MLKHDLEGVNSETTEKTRIQTLRAKNPGPFLILEQNDRSLISDR